MHILNLSTLYIIFLNVLVLGILVLVVYALYKLLKVDNQEAYELARERAFAKAAAVMENAQAKSLKIIRHANKNAQKVLTDAHLLTDDVRKELEEQIEAVSRGQADALKAMSAQVFTKYVTSMEAESARNIEEFRHTLEHETLESEKQIEERVQAEYAKVAAEIEEYKQAELRKLDSEIEARVTQIAKDVLGKATVDIKQADVLEALEEAKREGFFEKV